jgi:hypothetical protein
MLCNGSELLKEVKKADEFWANAPVNYGAPHYARFMELEVVVEKYCRTHDKLVIAMEKMCRTSVDISRFLRAVHIPEGGVQFLPKDDHNAILGMSHSPRTRYMGWECDLDKLIEGCQIRVRITKTKIGTFLVFTAYPWCPRFAMLEIYRWFDTGLSAKILDVGESRIIRSDGYPPADDLCWSRHSGLWDHSEVVDAQP